MLSRPCRVGSDKQSQCRFANGWPCADDAQLAASNPAAQHTIQPPNSRVHAVIRFLFGKQIVVHVENHLRDGNNLLGRPILRQFINLPANFFRRLDRISQLVSGKFYGLLSDFAQRPPHAGRFDVRHILITQHQRRHAALQQINQQRRIEIRHRVRNGNEVACLILSIQSLHDGKNFVANQIREIFNRQLNISRKNIASQDSTDNCPLAFSRLIGSGFLLTHRHSYPS